MSKKEYRIVGNGLAFKIQASRRTWFGKRVAMWVDMGKIHAGGIFLTEYYQSEEDAMKVMIELRDAAARKHEWKPIES